MQGSTAFDFFCPRTGVTEGLCRVYTASHRLAKVSGESCQPSLPPPCREAVLRCHLDPLTLFLCRLFTGRTGAISVTAISGIACF